MGNQMAGAGNMQLDEQRRRQGAGLPPNIPPGGNIVPPAPNLPINAMSGSQMGAPAPINAPSRMMPMGGDVNRQLATGVLASADDYITPMLGSPTGPVPEPTPAAGRPRTITRKAPKKKKAAAVAPQPKRVAPTTGGLERGPQEDYATNRVGMF